MEQEKTIDTTLLSEQEMQLLEAFVSRNREENEETTINENMIE